MRQLIKPDNFSTFCTDADFQDITNKYQVQFPEDLKQFLIEYEGLMVATIEQSNTSPDITRLLTNDEKTALGCD